MDESTRWTVKVSKETDVTLRTYLAQSGLRKGDLSKFIEEAVRWRVLDRTAAGVRERLGRTDPSELQTLIDDAVARVRAEHTARSKGSHARRGESVRKGRAARR
jgi:stalled ribosome alternative rescue factor ArfA